MKKLMMIAAMMVATLSANAQFEAGSFTLQPKVGMNLSKITADDTKYKAGLAAGFEGQYQINNWFALSAGVMYQQKGSKFKSSAYINTDKLKLNMEYIDIPVMAKFYVAKGLSLNAGLQPGFLTKAKSDWDGEETDIKDSFEKFNFEVPISIAYEFPMGLVIEARYSFGATDVGKNVEYEKGTSDWKKAYQNKNEVFQLTVGYKFAL